MVFQRRPGEVLGYWLNGENRLLVAPSASGFGSDVNPKNRSLLPLQAIAPTRRR